MVLLSYLFFVFLGSFCYALVGYDCERPSDNGTLLSLLELDECYLNEHDVISTNIGIELSHHTRFTTVDVISCRVEIDNVLKLKNIDSEVTLINQRYYSTISQSPCLYMHIHGKLKIGNTTLFGLVPKVVNSRLIPTNGNDTFQNSTLEISNIVSSYVHIVYKQQTVKVDLLVDKILLPVGTKCKYTSLECTDEEGHQNFWSPMFHNGCNLLTKNIIYRGLAKRVTLTRYSPGYAVPYGDTLMLFFIRTRQDACNTTAYQTEHAQLVLREVDDDYLKSHKSINKLRSFFLSSTDNYIHIIHKARSNVKSLYISLMLNKCNNKAIELRTALLAGSTDTSTFAYALTGEPGYSARLRGEAALLFRCTPIPTRLRITGACYQELPVIVDERPMYLKPRTRIITSEATEIDCDASTSALYNIKKQWHILTPALKKHGAVPEKTLPGSLPWGSQSMTNDDAVDKTKAPPSQHEESTNNSTLPYKITLITIIIFVCIVFAKTIAKRIRRKKEIHKYNQPQGVDHIDTLTSYYNSSQEKPSLVAHHWKTCNTEETLPPRSHPQAYESHSIIAEISELKLAYSSLECRINKFNSPAQTGVHQAHRRKTSPCSQLNEGGVTYGDST